jgi:hypothetical protein
VKNQLPDLQNLIFEQIERLMDDELDLEKEVRRSLALNELAKTAVSNGVLMAKCADSLYGVPISDKVPLIPARNTTRGSRTAKRKTCCRFQETTTPAVTEGAASSRYEKAGFKQWREPGASGFPSAEGGGNTQAGGITHDFHG